MDGPDLLKLKPGLSYFCNTLGAKEWPKGIIRQPLFGNVWDHFATSSYKELPNMVPEIAQTTTNYICWWDFPASITQKTTTTCWAWKF